MSEILLYENQGISWEIDTYNALNVIDLNGVSDPSGYQISGSQEKKRRSQIIGTS